MGSGRKKYLRNLYLGDKAAAVRDKIIRAVDRDAPFPDLYLITFASNGIDQLDIIEARYLANERISSSLPVIVGLAIGRHEAFETVRRIAGDTYRATGTADMVSYLKKTGVEEDPVSETADCR